MGARVIDFDPAGNGEIHIAGLDRARRIAHGIEPGRAQPVDCDTRNGFRQSGQQERHARHIAVVFAGLIGAAEKDLVELRPVGLRIARHQRADRGRGKVVGTQLGERAGVTADSGAHCVADEDLPHRHTLSKSCSACPSLSRDRRQGGQISGR